MKRILGLSFLLVLCWACLAQTNAVAPLVNPKFWHLEVDSAGASGRIVLSANGSQVTIQMTPTSPSTGDTLLIVFDVATGKAYIKGLDSLLGPSGSTDSLTLLFRGDQGDTCTYMYYNRADSGFYVKPCGVTAFKIGTATGAGTFLHVGIDTTGDGTADVTTTDSVMLVKGANVTFSYSGATKKLTISGAASGTGGDSVRFLVNVDSTHSLSYSGTAIVPDDSSATDLGSAAKPFNTVFTDNVNDTTYAFPAGSVYITGDTLWMRFHGDTAYHPWILDGPPTEGQLFKYTSGAFKLRSDSTATGASGDDVRVHPDSGAATQDVPSTFWIYGADRMRIYLVNGDSLEFRIDSVLHADVADSSDEAAHAYVADSAAQAAHAYAADSAGKATNDGAGNSITGTYETITNVAKIGDDTTEYKRARDSVNAWDNGVFDNYTVKIDSAGDGTNVVTKATDIILQEGANITFTVDNDTLTIAGGAGGSDNDTGTVLANVGTGAPETYAFIPGRDTIRVGDSAANKKIVIEPETGDSLQVKAHIVGDPTASGAAQFFVNSALQFWVGEAKNITFNPMYQSDTTVADSAYATLGTFKAFLGPFIDSTTLDTIQNAHKAVLADSASAIADGAVTATDKIAANAVETDDINYPPYRQDVIKEWSGWFGATDTVRHLVDHWKDDTLWGFAIYDSMSTANLLCSISVELQPPPGYTLIDSVHFWWQTSSGDSSVTSVDSIRVDTALSVSELPIQRLTVLSLQNQGTGTDGADVARVLSSFNTNISASSGFPLRFTFYGRSDQNGFIRGKMRILWDD